MHRKHPVYIIGDIHGDAEVLVHVLTCLDLIEIAPDRTTFDWVKPNVTLVFLGDLLDAKCRDSEFGNMAFEGSLSDLWILEFVAELQVQARRRGSYVECVLGNHEMMNLGGDFAYVSPHHVRSRAQRQAYFQGRGREILLGFWVNLTLNHTLYMHAGPPVGWTEDQIEQTRDRTLGQLVNEEGVPASTVLAWTSHRDVLFLYDDDTIAALCKRHGVRRIVVGHNVTPSKTVEVRGRRQLFLADVGLSRAFLGASTGEPGERRFEVLLDDGSGTLRTLSIDPL